MNKKNKGIALVLILFVISFFAFPQKAYAAFLGIGLDETEYNRRCGSEVIKQYGTVFTQTRFAEFQEMMHYCGLKIEEKDGTYVLSEDLTVKTMPKNKNENSKQLPLEKDGKRFELDDEYLDQYDEWLQNFHDYKVANELTPEDISDDEAENTAIKAQERIEEIQEAKLDASLTEEEIKALEEEEEKLAAVGELYEVYKSIDAQLEDSENLTEEEIEQLELKKTETLLSIKKVLSQGYTIFPGNIDSCSGTFGPLVVDAYNLIKWAAVAFMLIFIGLDLTKAIMSGDQEKMKAVTKNVGLRVTAGIFIILLPTIVKIILNLMGLDAMLCGL